MGRTDVTARGAKRSTDSNECQDPEDRRKGTRESQLEFRDERRRAYGEREGQTLCLRNHSGEGVCKRGAFQPMCSRAADDSSSHCMSTAGSESVSHKRSLSLR